MTDDARFTDWFKQATGNEPYPYQTRLACAPSLFRGAASDVGILVNGAEGIGQDGDGGAGVAVSGKF